MFSLTKDGDRFEYFKSVTIEATPKILADYLKRTNVYYAIYKIPNYVREFMANDDKFSLVYSLDTNKFVVVIFNPSEYISTNENAYGLFYNELKKLISTEYKGKINLIVIDEPQKPSYKEKLARIAYKDLKEYCGGFCLIDPKAGTMFVFNKISNTEIEALEVLFQQYYYFMRK